MDKEMTAVLSEGRSGIAEYTCWNRVQNLNVEKGRAGLMNAAIFSDKVNEGLIEQVYGYGRKQKIESLTNLYPEVITSDNFEDHAEQLRDLDVIFSTWGMPVLSAEQLNRLPRLKALFYAAGATRKFREPFLERGVPICSATAANAFPVAEFALAQVLLAGAGYFLNNRQCVDRYHASYGNHFRGHGNYGGRVSILGNGTISNRLQELLMPHKLDVVVVPSRVENRTVSLEEAFSSSFAVVNLFPDRDDNAGVFNAPLFASMINSAVFINVGRGRQVNEEALITVMKQRPDLTALLDVQWPEPPVEGSELYSLPNIELTGHIAGSKGAEFIRMADYMIEEFQRFEKGQPLQHEVHPDSL